MFAVTLNAKYLLSLMAYSFMGLDDAEDALSLEVRPRTLQEMSKRVEQTCKRLNDCCKGLIKASLLCHVNDKDKLTHSIHFSCKDDFLYRTVKDFLATVETQAFLSRWNLRAFDTDATICAALLS